MSAQPEPTEKIPTTTQPENASLGAQLTEMITRFNEMSMEMVAQRQLIDQLINSGVQPEPIPAKQLELEPPPPTQAASNPSFTVPPPMITRPQTQAAFNPSFIGPLEETFNYTIANPSYSYPPNPSFNPSHAQILPPQITSNISPEPQTLYQATAEPFLLDNAAQAKPEIGESSAPVDMKLLKRLDRFNEFMRKI